MRSLFGQACRILQKIRAPSSPKCYFSLYQKLQFKKELSVPTFCNISVDVPFSINLEPLDVHKYPNCDKLIVELNNFVGNDIQEPLLCSQEGNNIFIEDAISEDFSKEGLSCRVIAPIKANLNVSSKHGNIEIKNFNGEEITASSEIGNVTVNGYQGKQIHIRTSRGNVTLGGVVQSSSITVLISENGSVKANKLLGLNTNITTKCGDISVNSSFCNRSKFVVEQGDLILKNIHKHCEVVSKKSGNITISSLDGYLKLVQENGNSDIHLSRITENSEINLVNGHLLLRLSEECQEMINFIIQAKTINRKDNLKIKQDELSTETDNLKTVMINCNNCSVDIEAGSWFNMNFPKKDSL